MINAKEKMVITNILRRLGVAMLISAAWVIGIELVFDLLGLIFNHSWTSFVVSLEEIPSSLVSILNVVLFIYFLVTPYSDFKWSIQNGISRKTMGRGRLLALFLSTILLFLVDELLSLVHAPLHSWQELVVSFLALLTAILTFQMIGNGFGLLSRKWKVVVGIGLPICAVILLSGLLTGLATLMGNGDFGMIAYEDGHYVGPLMGLLNSPAGLTALLWTVWIVYLLIVLALNKLFNDHLQLRRD